LCRSFTMKREKFSDARRKKKKLKRERRHRGFIQVTAQLSCGCCTTEMLFKSRENAVAAFNKAGLDSSADITDDKGVAHSGVDTFYGFCETQKEAEELRNAPLLRLAKLAGFC